MVGTSSKIVHHPATEDDPQRRKPDIEKAFKGFGWKPKMPLKEGKFNMTSYESLVMIIRESLTVVITVIIDIPVILLTDPNRFCSFKFFFSSFWLIKRSQIRVHAF